MKISASHNELLKYTSVSSARSELRDAATQADGDNDESTVTINETRSSRGNVISPLRAITAASDTTVR